MGNTINFILDSLRKFNLAHFPGRPYDNAFELLAAPPARKRLIMMGFNGSFVDAHMTNARSIVQDRAFPFMSNLEKGIEGHWGITHLAKRLQKIPADLGYNLQDVIYTNALMMCSANAASLKKEANEFQLTTQDLIKNSMDFFENVTVALSAPEMIIVHGNSLSSISAAKLLLSHFGDIATLRYSQAKGYHTTFGFLASIKGRRIPVICVRHMSRFKPHEEYIKSAISLVAAQLNQ